MKILRLFGLIIILGSISFNSGCQSCSKEQTTTDELTSKYLQPEDCGSACLYKAGGRFSRLIDKTTTDISHVSHLNVESFVFSEKGWEKISDEITNVTIEGKNINKYTPKCVAAQCIPGINLSCNQYGRIVCSFLFINPADFSNQDTYTLYVLTNSYGEMKIEVPLYDVKFLSPVHITSPFDSDGITNISQLPVKVTLNNDSFTLTWDKIEGATAFSINSPSLGLSYYINENITGYTFNNVSSGRFRINISASASRSGTTAWIYTDLSDLIIDIETQ